MDEAWLRALVALPFGLVVGSFMTVAVHRLPRGESVVRPRSRCPSCGAPIEPRDNVPVVSWLLLRGRCRSCGASIPIRYPVLELATAGLVVLSVVRHPDPWVGGLVAGLLAPMPAIAAIDIAHRKIPNRLTYPALVLFPIAIVVAWLAGAPVEPLRGLVGLALFGGVLFVVALVSRGMGMGDVKLAAVIGLVLGAIALRLVGVAGGAAVVLGGVGGIAALAMGRSRKDAIPFGPYLAAGAVVAGLWGEAIAAWYLGRFGLG